MNSHQPRFTLPGLPTVAVLWALTAVAYAPPLQARTETSPQTAVATDTRSMQARLADEVQALLRARAKQRFADAQVNVRTQPLDPRLALAACGELELTPRSDNLYGRIPVAVRCLGPQPWSVFLTGDVSVTLPVVVATRSMARGSQISSGDLVLEPKDLARLRNQYLTSLEPALGMEIRSPLQPNAVIYANMLKEPLAVHRGEKVTILAKRGSVHIQARGEALQDGMKGAQIRVKNGQSERTVHAWVQGPGLVATTP